MHVARYTPDLAPAFEALNREWIEAYFVVEPADRAVFADPHAAIIAPGGEIFFVIADGEPLGTCAVMPLGPATYELAKMAVSPRARGRGYGDLLLEAAIEFSREAGAETLMLVSNSRLAAAQRLYHKHGFRRVPVSDAHRYERVDVQMALDLKDRR